MTYNVLILFCSITGLAFATIGILRYGFLIVVVHGQSMSPTLEHNIRVLVWRFWPSCWLHRGQIVVLYHRETMMPAGSSFGAVIKRIVGLPGDSITISFENPKHGVYDNQIAYTWQVPSRHIFICGDNRMESVDSLTWGPVLIDHFCGIVFRKLK